MGLTPAQKLLAFAKSLTTIHKRAETLLEDGYHYSLQDGLDNRPFCGGRVDVYRPGETEPAYHIDVYQDKRGEWKYACSCPSCAEWMQCKHGERLMLLLFAAWRLVRHCEAGRQLTHVSPSAKPDNLIYHKARGFQSRADYERERNADFGG